MILKFVSLSFLIMILTRATAAFKLPSKRLLPHFSTKLHYHIASLVGTQTSSDGLGPLSQSLQVINVVGESEMEELGASFAKVLRAGHVLLLRGNQCCTCCAYY